MKIRRFQAAICAIAAMMFLLNAACASQPEPPAVDLAAEEAAVRAISQHWQELEAQKDATAVAALFSDNAQLFWDDQPFTSGKAAIETLLTEDYQANPMEMTTWETERVDMAESGDLAMEYGTYMVTNPMDGEEEEMIEGRYMTGYRKIDGEWRITVDAGKIVTADVVQ